MLGIGSLNPYAHRNLAQSRDGIPPHMRLEIPDDLKGARALRLALTAHDAEVNDILAPYYRTALAAHKELLEKAPAYAKRAKIRAAVSEYLAGVAEQTNDPTFATLSDKLRRARRWAVWGIDIDGTLRLQWDGRAGLVKLCPDDAREEGKRVVEQYVPALMELRQAKRRELRFAVFTLPNVDQGDLQATIKKIFAEFREKILYAKRGGGVVSSLNDPRRLFPYIEGAMATVEAPLSKNGDWNVHLNVLLVSRGMPNYKALRAQWGFNVHFDYIRGRRGDALHAGLAEIVKYPLQAISQKSEEKADGGWTDAPGLTQWPAMTFAEWYRAHYRLRRTRSWGCLYGVEKPEPTPPLFVTWCGRMEFDAASGRMKVQCPRLDTRRPAALNSIQGNKSNDSAYGEYHPEPRAPPFH